ncbi:MAG: PEGA domain-containing protein [Myxococcales bacterium]|nr:PEGA domain-containing protein [Myxococcales bacterium]
MIRAAAGLAIAAVAMTATAARADDDGFIGRPRVRLEVDDCPAPPSVTKAELEARFTDHYDRGLVLYLQGDYGGSIDEWIAAYCLIPLPTVLKDIGQAHDRSVRYELAIAYFERFVIATEDAVARATVSARIQVLSRQASTVRVATDPPNAKITVRNAQQAVAYATANTDDVLSLPAGSYTMQVELPNYEPVEQPLTIGIGEPYSYSFRLQPRRGRLRINTVPGDARILVDDRLVGQGSFDGELDLGPHKIAVEQPGWLPTQQTIEVREVGTAEASIALARPPSTARWMAIGGATAYGLYAGVSIGSLVDTSDDGSTAAATGLAGLVVGGIGGYLLIPEDIHHGTASLLLTATATGAIGGFEAGLALSDDSSVLTSTALGGSVAGATIAVLAARQGEIGEGQAAIVNSGVLWGTVSGLLFTQVFAGSDRTDLALTSAGSGLGLITGVVLAKRYGISRKRVIYIDLAGTAGLVAGLAVQNGAQSSSTGTSASDESRSHFTLAGMAIGLGLGVYLTRNLDAPVLRLQPTVTPVRDRAGGRGLVVGLGGAL